MFLQLGPDHHEDGVMFLTNSFLDNSSFLFECMNNLCGVYNSDTGITTWKYQYQNSIHDKSDYFINTQIAKDSLLCANFKNDRVVMSQFHTTPSCTDLVPKIHCGLGHLDSKEHFIREVVCVNPWSPQPNIIFLGSDNTLQCIPGVVSQTPSSTSPNNILTQMADMYS
jgi:hypothetical protein